MALRAFKGTSCALLVQRLLGPAPPVQIIHKRLDIVFIAFLEGECNIDNDLALLHETALAVRISQILFVINNKVAARIADRCPGNDF